LPDIQQTVLWKYLYDEVVNGIPSVLKLEEGREVVRITEEALKFCGLGPAAAPR
jgi:hypothetical protein